ncbi:exported hypothetical protein [Frankia sp. Hr75.2]|nr:exported hypothetical protein [Frankia sp. Hr75.2]SQD97444.1 exported hypothetical protein [Parafrankia sp. Ea1.12]
MAVGSPHAASQPVIVSISGACAVPICWASASTAGSAARSGASSAIFTACWWCGIIIWANITSALLWALSLASLLLPAVADDGPVGVSSPPHAASVAVRASATAASPRWRLLRTSRPRCRIANGSEAGVVERADRRA